MEEQARQLRRPMNHSVAPDDGHWTRFVNWESGGFVEIAGTATGRAAELPAPAHREERGALGALLGKADTSRHVRATTSSLRGWRSLNCCSTWSR